MEIFFWHTNSWSQGLGVLKWWKRIKFQDHALLWNSLSQFYKPHCVKNWFETFDFEIEFDSLPPSLADVLKTTWYHFRCAEFMESLMLLVWCCLSFIERGQSILVFSVAFSSTESLSRDLNTKYPLWSNKIIIKIIDHFTQPYTFLKPRSIAWNALSIPCADWWSRSRLSLIAD
jgi:hypothetical protein